MSTLQHALAAEVRAEMAVQRMTATEMQERTGIAHASWRNWYITASRPVPLSAVDSVCEVLGVEPEEMMRRASVRRAATHKEGGHRPLTRVEYLKSLLSPEDQAQVREAEAIIAEREKREKRNGV